MDDNKNNLSLGQKDALNLERFKTSNALNRGVVFVLNY
jgi:hypothetical protein